VISKKIRILFSITIVKLGRFDARTGSKNASLRTRTTFTAEGPPATPVDDAEDEQTQVTRDVRSVVVAVLVDKHRRTISCGLERKVAATSLFLHTASSERGLVSRNAFLNSVKRMTNDDSVRREARAVVTEECASASDGSENTAIVINSHALGMTSVYEIRSVSLRKWCVHSPAVTFHSTLSAKTGVEGRACSASRTRRSSQTW